MARYQFTTPLISPYAWTDGQTGSWFDWFTTQVSKDPVMALIPEADVAEGMAAMNGLANMLVQGIRETGIGADGRISADDVRVLNTWFKADPARMQEFIRIHGQDGPGEDDYGFHCIQAEGNLTHLFGHGIINYVADDLFHIGFDIVGDRFNNEDGDPNILVSDFAMWLDTIYSDLSTTNTGLDTITDIIRTDMGMMSETEAAAINEGARAADALNKMIIQGLTAVGATNDGMISREDVLALNQWVRADKARFAEYKTLHGSEANGGTGIHAVVGNGGTNSIFSLNAIDTVADGLYSFGFTVPGNERFRTEDGKLGAYVADVASWLNYLYLGKPIIQDSEGNGQIKGSLAGETIFGNGGDDLISCGGGNDVVYGGAGYDTIRGEEGNDTIYGGDGASNYIDGGRGNDVIYGGDAGERIWGGTDNDYVHGGAGADQLWGNLGIDTLEGGLGSDVMYGGDANDTLFGGAGNDRLWGDAGADTLEGGFGADQLYGGAGDDVILSRSDAGEPTPAKGGSTVSPAMAEGSADVLYGEAGADNFRFELTVNAKASVLAANADANGVINWSGVMATNAATHDHWVESVGNDRVMDFNKAEGDSITIVGANVSVRTIGYSDANKDGVQDSIIYLSVKNTGGADDGDAVGVITVLSNRLVAGDITVVNQVIGSFDDLSHAARADWAHVA